MSFARSPANRMIGVSPMTRGVPDEFAQRHRANVRAAFGFAVMDMADEAMKNEYAGIDMPTWREIKTVDGHVFHISLDYLGFEGPDTLHGEAA